MMDINTSKSETREAEIQEFMEIYCTLTPENRRKVENAMLVMLVENNNSKGGEK